MARILVIEDDAAARAVLTQALRAAGHEVLAASSGREALYLAHRQPLHLVLTDWHLDGPPEGEALLGGLRRIQGPALPIVVVSGDRDLHAPTARSVLLKPYSLADLFVLVQSLTEMEGPHE